MSKDMYTITSMAEELQEEGIDVSEERVQEVFEDLEEQGVAKCVDGEHWKVNSTRAAIFLLKTLKAV